MSEQEAAYTSTTLQARREALAEIELKVRRGREALLEAEASLADVSARHRALVAARLSGDPDAAEPEILAQVVAATQQRDALHSVVLSFQEEHKAAEQAVDAAEEAAQTAQAIATWDNLSQQQQRAVERFAKAIREVGAAMDKVRELSAEQARLVPRLRRHHPRLKHVREPSSLYPESVRQLRHIFSAVLGDYRLFSLEASDRDPRVARLLRDPGKLSDKIIARLVVCAPIGTEAAAPAEEEDAS